VGVEGYPTVSALVPAPAVPASVVAAASSVASSCVTLTYRVPRLPRERSECGGGLWRGLRWRVRARLLWRVPRVLGSGVRA
jgi:hypothetical protein